MSFVHDQEVVETLGADRPHEPLGVSINIGRPERRLEDLGTPTGEHLVETPHVLRVAVSEEEPASMPASSRSAETLRACWVTHDATGWAVTPVIHTRRRPSSMKMST